MKTFFIRLTAAAVLATSLSGCIIVEKHYHDAPPAHLTEAE